MVEKWESHSNQKSFRCMFKTQSKICDEAFSRQQLMACNRYILSWKTSIIDVRLAYKSFLSRFSMLINYTMWSSNLFCCIQLFPTFFIVQDFQICQGLGFSESRIFWVQVFQGLGPGSESRF